MAKTGTKKKDLTKSALSVSQFLRSTDSEIKAELEAMTNLEYNLHSDFDSSDRQPDAPLFSVRKARSMNAKKSSKQDKQVVVGGDKASTKTDKFDNDNQVHTYVPNASVEELQAVVCQAAATSEDKYRILDARDRLMRMKQTKSQLLSMTKVTRGTCPDMCPEKERMMRESQRQVAAYELLEGGDYRINHETAVKQYSRSSADQEEPMPQDLRPVKSLRMTMSYLLHEIADLCEQSGCNLAEWYHFLWDRTRGIRKDITQQELCCDASVELVEQCARFHIVCAERLCAEEVSVFDKKINTENLTKCLQTLKYMYHDLRLKGIACKNEPEFRAYIILLNLNNGNFMWDVQRLPTSVQKSAEIRFAIEVYSAVESNNYAKFFRLVRETTYLNACILLRYFNQVRVRALSIMVKAYCRTASTAFPLYEFIDILGFEDENDAVYFSEQVGLNLSNDDLHIMLNRQNFSLPMSNIEQGRACNTVESKRLSNRHSIGQSIAGDALPEKLYKNHKPHNSFDGHGCLKAESLNAEDQNAEKIIKPEDPYEYMEEDVLEPPQTFRPQPDPKTSVSPGETFDSKVSQQKKQTGTAHIFKMPIVTNQSSVLQSSNPFAKQSSIPASNKKSDQVSPFGPVAIAAKPQKREPGSATGFTGSKSKPQEFDRSAPLKRSRDEDASQSLPKTATVFNYFDDTPRPTTTFATPVERSAKTFRAQTGPFSRPSEKPQTAGIFGKPIETNIFGNVAPMPSIFAGASYNESRSLEKSGESWSTGKSSRSQISPNTKESSIPKSPEASKLRELQESEQKLESERRRRLFEDEQEKKRRRFERETEYDNLSAKIVDEIIDELIRKDCESLLNREIYVQRKLDELSRRTRNRIILKYYRIWRQYSSRKKQQRNALDGTPVWLQRRSVEECAKSLYNKEQDAAIRNMRRKRSKFNHADNKLEYLQPIETRIYAGIKENARALDIHVPPNLFWKMIISWPNLENRPVLRRLKRIMNQYICPSDCANMSVVKSYKPNAYETLHICVKHFEGPIADHHLTGSDGLFFVATSAENPTYIVRRLTSTILSRRKLMPIPVMVVILGEADLPARKIKLNHDLNALLESGYISEYTINYEEKVNERTILGSIQNATLWLTVNKSPPIPLEMDFIGTVVDACLTEELWHRILGHASFNKHLESALEDVKFLIDLHNEAVGHLIDIVLDPETLLYTDFPPEFKKFTRHDNDLPCGYEYFDSAWKNDECREKLERTMNDLLLPKWTFGWPIDDTTELQCCVVRYCQRALDDSNYDSVSCNIFCDVLLMSRSACKTSFIQVLLEILKEKIRHVKDDARVVYNKNHVRHFRTLPWWFKSTTLTTYSASTNRAIAASVPNDRSTIVDDSLSFEEDENDISDIIKNCEGIFETDIPEISLRSETQKQASEFRRISEALEKSFSEQKSRCRILEEKLKAALDDKDSLGVP